MTDSRDLTDAQVLLIATRFISEGQLELLRQLVSRHRDVLAPEIVYRILLTYLTQDAPIQELVLLLKELQNWPSKLESSPPGPFAIPGPEIKPKDAYEQVRRLRLQTLLERDYIPSEDLLCRFLVTRTHRLETVDDDLLPFLQVILPFAEDTPALQEWLITKLLPLIRLKYEYYPNSDLQLNLEVLDILRGETGVRALMGSAERESESAEVGRDLRKVVAPWVYGENGVKRRRLSISQGTDVSSSRCRWQDINEWIFSISSPNFALAAKAVLEWNGPADIDLASLPNSDHVQSPDEVSNYNQTAMAIIYALDDFTGDKLTACRRILERVSGRTGFTLLSPTEPEYSIFPQSLTQSSRESLLHNAFLRPQNQLTMPSGFSLNFLNALIESILRLRRFRSPLNVRQAAQLVLFGSEKQQRQELRRLIQQLSQTPHSSSDWLASREEILWLRAWSHPSKNQPSIRHGWEARGLLWRLTSVQVETEILHAMLAASQYDIAVGIYIKDSKPLSHDEVEKCVQEAIFNAYDNASNGNRTRGGVKKAFDILKAFQPHFPNSTSLKEIDRLLAGTHSLSFYHLTLQQGVPFQPVSIRVHKDPVSLIQKILEQNERAYTKLDDLLAIGRNFVEAGLPTPPNKTSQSESLESKIFDSERRITYLAINSALSSDDFDTAYSYITTRLSPSSSQSSDFIDDTSWRAAYSGGRYQPSNLQAKGHAHGLASKISLFSRRMELLSLALTLAPTPEPLPEILQTWQECEVAMEGYRLQELGDDQAANQGGIGTGIVPGGFGDAEQDRQGDMAETTRMANLRSLPRRTGGVYEDEAPMGLFDVARGAANALQKTASAWGSPGVGNTATGLPAGLSAAASKRASLNTLQDRDQGHMRQSSRDDLGSDQDHGRVRKRDMVSNMITGGVVSGLGWVLGAQPVSKPEDNDSEQS